MTDAPRPVEPSEAATIAADKAHDAVIGRFLEEGSDESVLEPMRQGLRAAYAIDLAALQQRIAELEARVANLDAAEECLQMVGEDLAAYGVSMKGTPPMFYNDALRSVVNRLARKAGFTTVGQVADFIRGTPTPEEP